MAHCLHRERPSVTCSRLYFVYYVGHDQVGEEEYAFYAEPENQEPQGPARKRRPTRLSAPGPVRFPPELLDQIRRARHADARSLSSWIRLAVEHELRRTAVQCARLVARSSPLVATASASICTQLPE